MINDDYFLWISSNFCQATFIEGALKYGKIIYGLIHRKIWKPAKAFQKLDDRNWSKAFHFKVPYLGISLCKSFQIFFRWILSSLIPSPFSNVEYSNLEIQKCLYFARNFYQICWNGSIFKGLLVLHWRPIFSLWGFAKIFFPFL